MRVFVDRTALRAVNVVECGGDAPAVTLLSRMESILIPQSVYIEFQFLCQMYLVSYLGYFLKRLLEPASY